MMTRAQVARRLGKSIATVRRMEGVEFHPWVDDRGVNRFDPVDVERVAAGGTGQLPQRLLLDSTESPADEAPDHDELQRDLERARRDATERKYALERETERVAEREGKIERLEDENRDLRDAFRTCATVLVSALGPRQIAELGEEGLEALQAMIELCG